MRNGKKTILSKGGIMSLKRNEGAFYKKEHQDEGHHKHGTEGW